MAFPERQESFIVRPHPLPEKERTMTPREAVTFFEAKMKQEPLGKGHPVAVWLLACCAIEVDGLEELDDLYRSFRAFYDRRKDGIFAEAARAFYPTPRSLTKALRRLAMEGVGVGLAYYNSKIVWMSRIRQSRRMIQGLRLLW